MIVSMGGINIKTKELEKVALKFIPSQIFNCLTSDVKSHDKLKDNYGRTTQVNEAFSFYEF